MTAAELRYDLPRATYDPDVSASERASFVSASGARPAMGTREAIGGSFEHGQ
jgi:hypothetical protein